MYRFSRPRPFLTVLSLPIADTSHPLSGPSANRTKKSGPVFEGLETTGYGVDYRSTSINLNLNLIDFTLFYCLGQRTSVNDVEFTSQLCRPVTEGMICLSPISYVVGTGSPCKSLTSCLGPRGTPTNLQRTECPHSSRS